MCKKLARCFLVSLCFVIVSQCAFCQSPVYVYKTKGDSTQNFYVKRVPEGAIKGILAINLRSVSDSIKTYALDNGIMLLSLVPVKVDNALELMTSDVALDRIDKMIAEVANTYHVPADKIVIGGMSVAGTGAVRYAEYCLSERSKAHIKPAGVFAVDPALDYERFYKASMNAINRKFNNDAVEEGKAVIKLFTSAFNGTPFSNLKAYQVNSPFSYSSINGGNARFLNTTAVRLYTEPDINWWIENRRRDYYDFNSIDDAALINQLKLNGNNKAELIAMVPGIRTRGQLLMKKT
jgi:hypothetical protein